MVDLIQILVFGRLLSVDNKYPVQHSPGVQRSQIEIQYPMPYLMPFSLNWEKNNDAIYQPMP